jgi:hypothetical protein
MPEEMDMHNPQTEKEDCELKSFRRPSQRLKKEFPKLPICLVADALYACQAVVVICQQFDWKYVLTLKEGRQPTTWEEALKLIGRDGPRSKAWLVPSGRACAPCACRRTCRRWAKSVSASPSQVAPKAASPIPLTI